MAKTRSSNSPVFTIFFLLLLASAYSISFNFSRFDPNTPGITYQGDAFSSSGVIQVTKNQQDISLTSSVGRATYDQPILIWDPKTRELTDFITHFSFVIKAVDNEPYGDGLAFFLSPFKAEIPTNSAGSYLGLISNTSHDNPQIVAVEFDTYEDVWDPDSNHVGINVNSIVSKNSVKWKSSIRNANSTANAWVSYNSTTMNLSVFLTYAEKPVFDGSYSLSYVVDLREVLPEYVSVGFSAATSQSVEIHNIKSWSFDSSLEAGEKKRIVLVVGLVVGLVVLFCLIGLFWIVIKKFGAKKVDLDHDDDLDDREFEKGTGPRRFTYRDLKAATNDFAEEGKLGEGGFGGVYKGLLRDKKMEAAVKRVSKGSKQGKKEYASEVKIISRLRHRNLVQLIGWCHEQGELLLVYEFLPNGSLDSHLFGGKGKPRLPWSVRYKIALGLSSALLYLHEEWEQCVVHRDIKSSNIMLDLNYNAKLGDFGLARLVDHELGSQTTVLAGTMGYLAPECVTTGKASKESDVYSFGVVALEIACGRKPVEAKLEPREVRLVEWVWGLYGTGEVLEAADKGLMAVYDERELECLMVVGLWCCHPDDTMRPSIRQVINVLKFEAPLPRLPAKLPVPMYFAPPMNDCRFSYTSSAGVSGSDKCRTGCSCSGCSTSTISAGSSKALLQLRRPNV